MDGSSTTPSHSAQCDGAALPAHFASQPNDNAHAELCSLVSTHTMMELLQNADAAVASDQARARQLIDRAMDILRATLDEDGNAPAAATRAGRLAPWQERRLKAHIEANLTASLTTVDLAGVVNLSPSYFSRAFKRSFGTPPHSYLTIRRTMRAQELMLTTDEPLSQIAVACGLVDQSHLCRLFRRTVGRNPRAWRRAFKADTAGDLAKPIQFEPPS
jgi:AraC family transcriptional regulator